MCVLVKYEWLYGSACVVAILADGVQAREKDKGWLVLCSPKFICKNNWYFGLSSTYFLYPLTSLPKMVKQEMHASIKQS